MIADIAATVPSRVHNGIDARAAHEARLSPREQHAKEPRHPVKTSAGLRRLQVCA
ncbi:MAG: hypothetical protein ACRD10_03550 [Terriglobia bacterium]